MQDRGFIAIYRWRVPAEDEVRFRAAWAEITDSGRAAGSYGSLLARSEEGLLIAIALWPSRAARDTAFAQMTASPDWPLAERISEETLSVLDDRWRDTPFR